MSCMMYCANGFKRDRSGCDVCECLESDGEPMIAAMQEEDVCQVIHALFTSYYRKIHTYWGGQVNTGVHSKEGILIQEYILVRAL